MLSDEDLKRIEALMLPPLDDVGVRNAFLAGAVRDLLSDRRELVEKAENLTQQYGQLVMAANEAVRFCKCQTTSDNPCYTCRALASAFDCYWLKKDPAWTRRSDELLAERDALKAQLADHENVAWVAARKATP